MTDFMIHFLICNLLISGMIALLFAVKKIWQNHLTSRAQYNLWLLPLCLMVFPFIPLRFYRFFSLFSQVAGNFRGTASDHPSSDAISISAASSDWMNDFTLSVSRETPSCLWTILFWIWIAGIFIMLILTLKSAIRLRRIKKSALPLQNRKVQSLYAGCLKEMGITRNIPVYSTAFLASPVITGVINPRIYLPIHLISDYDPDSIRHMLLHELQHYRHRDNLFNDLFLLAGILYWFNPLVLLAQKAMRRDREIACDSAVLNMLDSDACRDYGYTLIRFAEKISLSPFPFSSSLAGNVKQMERRIRNIATYRKPSPQKRRKSTALFALTAILFAAIVPALPSAAAPEDRYWSDTFDGEVTSVDLSEYFGEYEGSFVLYDENRNQWSIYNRDMAFQRTAPNSTYKIYDGLFALEEGVITPEDSLLTWNRTDYPFAAWNQDQTLQTSLTNSVNWYFQTLDTRLGKDILASYIQRIGYGNEDISGDLSSYWMESSLKISPIEQVKLLQSFRKNDFQFAPENVQAVKDGIRLSSSAAGTLYGKTGTGNVNGQNVNGWFVGFVETSENTCYFAVNIQSADDATGSRAAEIALSVLGELGMWG